MYPTTDDLRSWRRPKPLALRIERQIKWVQTTLDSGQVPICHDVDQFDDDTLMVYFERVVRAAMRNHHGVSYNRSKPMSPIAMSPAKHPDYGWIVEFSLYDSKSNLYSLPDMSIVTAWLDETGAGTYGIIGASFVAFTDESDAVLCSLRFR